MIVLGSLFCSCVHAYASSRGIDSDTKLFPLVSAVDGTLGYVDALGKIRIPFRFESDENSPDLDEQFSQFFEGFAGIALCDNGNTLLCNYKYSYINERGELITDLKFDSIARFSEGFGLVQLNGKVGFISGAGKIVIPVEFKKAGSFFEGLAPACIESGCGFIDKTGKFVIEPRFDDTDEFSEDLAAVGVGGKYGYIDKTGKMVIEPQFGSASYFSEGLALVGKPANKESAESTNLTWPEGYINTQGRLVINTQFKHFTGIADFSEGRALIESISKRQFSTTYFGYINRKGQIVVPPKYEAAESFSEGLALVSRHPDDDRWEYIDHIGKVILRRSLHTAHSFNNGLARVELLGRPDRRLPNSIDETITEAYINRRGKVIVRGRLRYFSGYGGGEEDEANLVPITIDSDPQGAKVFLVPLVDLDDEPNLLNTPKIANYRTPTDTTYKDKVYEQVYRVVLELDGRRETRPLDVHSKKDNIVVVHFNRDMSSQKPTPKSTSIIKQRINRRSSRRRH